MMRILTQEEAKEAENRLDEFLLSLPFNVKIGIRDTLSPLLKQINCQHDWVETNSYENHFPKDSKVCINCSLVVK